MSISYSGTDPVTNLPLVGPRYEEKLRRLGIETLHDLLHHFPFRYSDTSDIISITELIVKGEGTIMATIESITNSRTRSRKWLTKATLSDHSGRITAVWFNQPFLTKTLKRGETFLFNGKLSTKWGRNLSNPQYEKASDETTHLGKLTPIYPETYGVSSKWLRARIKPLQNHIPDIVEDFIPFQIQKKEKVIPLSSAIEKIHFPESEKDIKDAQERLGLNELINIQIQAQKFFEKKNKYDAIKIKSDINSLLVRKLLDSLEFELTGSQENAINEILNDFNEEKPMHRLLNGDVGSGKTIVGLAAAVATYDQGFSTVIMAPTTILAQQHYQTISKTLNDGDITIPIQLLTSDSKGEVGNSPQIIIGTHALIYKQELPINTAFIIIDEQHRFGVEQRETLEKLGQTNGNRSPHYLTMTATPIPRSLTLVLYGQTNVSILDEMPKGRKPIKTYLIPQDKRQDSYKWIKDRIEKEDDQAFIICPLVEDSEKVEAKAAKEEYKRLSKDVFPDLRLGLVHGQLKEEEKNTILNQFKDKKFDILVATPVVEVGIDVPNATIMIIENAERFGLAQLHQFRGRIGRGDQQSYCFLFTDATDKTRIDRLKYFCKNNSGFKVAEYDLKNRGPGEVYGIKQSGILQLRFADITNMKQIKRAQNIAEKING
ncbi:ATP-dependent DNA helicase RecG [Candidatus Dojkabacteria bacterium]|nr:ATP-dependent DNA helicase RecG [Candidatus Dojkabacteria bacterium]